MYKDLKMPYAAKLATAYNGNSRERATVFGGTIAQRIIYGWRVYQRMMNPGITVPFTYLRPFNNTTHF